MNAWHKPVPFNLIPTDDSDSFKQMQAGETGLPLLPHLGAFSANRQHHTHEGVDFYVPDGTPVHAVEDGAVVGVMPFTGVAAGCDWWHDTDAVLVEGATGVVVYGEITPAVKNGDSVKRGDVVGHIKQVLKEDKGRPMSMLHLELHKHGTRDVYEWTDKTGRPDSLLDPTPHLLNTVDVG
jgi:murein DD-endopeptidase MepM/ murein hydrolase activator NlpD